MRQKHGQSSGLTLDASSTQKRTLFGTGKPIEVNQLSDAGLSFMEANKRTSFRWSKKKLGAPNVVPNQCRCCGDLMHNRGWIINGTTVTCLACNNYFDLGGIYGI